MTVSHERSPTNRPSEVVARPPTTGHDSFTQLAGRMSLVRRRPGLPCGSDGGEQGGERAGQGVPGARRLDEQPCVAQFAARTAAQEAPHLGFELPATPGRLALQRAERPEV